jgi:CheY-like chemotaxis protein
MKILIVEDERTLLTFLEKLLLGCGLDVKACRSGSAAAEALESWQPDLLISDLGLPDVPGEVLARAAARLARPARVVLISGDAERLEVARPLASSVLLKPFRVLELMKIVGPSVEDR